MHPSLRSLAVVAAAGAITACATRAGVVGDETTYTADLGTAPYDVLVRSLERVLEEERGYVLARREEQYTALYYATEWVSDDGEATDPPDPGGVGARSRIVVRARRSGAEYRVTFHGERRVRTESRPEWHRAPIPPDFAGTMDEIVGALAAELGAGGEDPRRTLSGPDRPGRPPNRNVERGRTG